MSVWTVTELRLARRAARTLMTHMNKAGWSTAAKRTRIELLRERIRRDVEELNACIKAEEEALRERPGRDYEQRTGAEQSSGGPNIAGHGKTPLPDL